MELDKIKTENSERGFAARNAVRKLKELGDQVEYILFETIQHISDYNDDKILDIAKAFGYGIVTGDFLLQLKAKALGIEVVDTFSNDNEIDNYTGFKEIDLDNNQLQNFYNEIDKNIFDLLINQYLIINNVEENEKYLFKWNGEIHQQVKTKPFQSHLLGKFSPYDVYQQCAIDSLNTNQVTMIKGKAGTGKSLIAISYGVHCLEKGKYDKLIFFVNPMASRNSARLGFYPGSRDEKLLDSSVGSMLSSKFGNKFQVEEMIRKEEILLLPFSDIRGFDTTGMKAFVHILEAQNLDIDLMKLAIERIGNDSKLVIDGDYTSQVDSVYYEGANNGMRRVSEVFRGEDCYGEIELQKIYRSKIAEIASRM
jgi:predicted ribonuclease YlaK